MKITLLAIALLICGATSASATKDKNPCASIDNSLAVFDSTSKEFKGCRLISVQMGSVYDSLGLRQGDVVQPAGSATSDGHRLEIQSSSLKTTKQDSTEQ